MNKAEIFSVIRSDRKNDMKEWVDYHFAIGFDKINILDNESSYSIKDFLRPYKNIKVKEIKIDRLLDDAIPILYQQYSKEIETRKNYVAFIDNDEYIYIKNNKTINDILNDEMEVLCIYWKFLSSRELLEDRDGTMIDTFNYTIPFIPNSGKRAQTKSIVNFNRCKDTKWDTDGPHAPNSGNKKAITGETMKNGFGNTLITENFYENQEIYLYHYSHQTHVDFIFKGERRPHINQNFYWREDVYSLLDNTMIDKKRELNI